MPTTQPIIWDHITSLVIALTGLVTAIAALWKIIGIKADAKSANDKADLANTRATNNAQGLTALNQQVNQIALQTPPPPPTSPAIPPDFTGAQITGPK